MKRLKDLLIKMKNTIMGEILFDTTDFQNFSTDKLLDIFTNEVRKQEEDCQSSKEKYDDRVCSECDTSDNVVDDYTKGVAVCQKCGQITKNITDTNPEWHNYDDSNGVDNTRCSIITNNILPSSSATTRLVGGDARLRKAHIWIQGSYRDRSLRSIQDKLFGYCAKGKISKKLAQEAFSIYLRINDCVHKDGENAGNKVITRGKNRKSLIAACIYFACKKYNESRCSKEIANICDLDYTDVNKGCKTFNKLINLCEDSYQLKISIPEHFVERFCRNLSIKKPFSTQAITIAKNARKLNLASDHTPKSIATGSILLMIEMNRMSITKQELSDRFEVSSVTISKAYDKIRKFQKVVVNDRLTDMYVETMNKLKKNVIVEKIPEETNPYELDSKIIDIKEKLIERREKIREKNYQILKRADKLR